METVINILQVIFAAALAVGGVLWIFEYKLAPKDNWSDRKKA